MIPQKTKQEIQEFLDNHKGYVPGDVEILRVNQNVDLMKIYLSYGLKDPTKIKPKPKPKLVLNPDGSVSKASKRSKILFVRGFNPPTPIKDIKTLPKDKLRALADRFNGYRSSFLVTEKYVTEVNAYYKEILKNCINKKVLTDAYLKKYVERIAKIDENPNVW